MAQELVNLDELTLQDGQLFHTKKGKPVEFPHPLMPIAESHGHLPLLRQHEPSVALCRAALAGVGLMVVPVDPVSDRIPDPAALDVWFANVCAEATERLDQCAEHGLTVPDFPLLAAGDANADSAGGAGADSADGAPSLVDNVRFVAGTHPYGAAVLMAEKDARDKLDALLASPLCVGVGEIGLDFGPYNELGEDVQLEAFRYQLRLAHRLDMPVELHIRSAADDESARAHQLAVQVLREEDVPRRGVDLHCFTSGPEVMRPFVELGCHVAFGGAATFNKSADIRAALVECPADQLLLETDAPYMAPVPLRGQECEPAMVAFTAGLAADVRAQLGGIPREETYRAQWDNARRLFAM